MRLAAIAAAIAAAAFLPSEPLGIAVPIVAVLVAVAARRGNAVYAALALALASTAAVLDAGWVVGLDLLAAWILASVAVAGPRVAALAAPFVRLGDARPPEVPAGASPALRGALLGGVLAVPFGALFWSGDAAFAELLRRVPFPDAWSLPGRTAAFVVVLAAALGLGLAARRPLAVAIPRPGRCLALLEWAVPLAVLNALFLAFVIVQLAVLFGGNDHVLRTAGLTYAEYARSGFWQLLAAAALTLAVVGAAVVLTEDGPLRNLLLGVLLACTGVVLASAVHRLHLYEDAYGLTRARLLAESICFWLGGVIVLVAAAGLVRPLARRFAHAVVAGTAAALLGFSLASPDAIIAKRNVDHWRETGRFDVLYARELSADAVPALAELPPELRDDALRGRLREDEPWSSANLSRARARDVLARLDG